MCAKNYVSKPVYIPYNISINEKSDIFNFWEYLGKAYNIMSDIDKM